jgi:hypothetical protein
MNGDRNEFSVIDIVDGQQRLTTFVIFVNELIRQLITKGSLLVSERTYRIFIKDGDVFKLETSNEDNSFLHSVVFNSNPTACVGFNTKSEKLLFDAKMYFNQEIEKFDLAMLERIYLTAINAEVLLYVVDQINAATQIFELLNDRGRKLSDLEVVKSFLMYNAGLLSSNPDQIIRNIQSDFSEIYRLIEKHDIIERDVLRYHTIAFERCATEYQDKPKEFIKNKITQLVNSDASRSSVIGEVQGYSTRLKDSFLVYSKIQGEKSKKHTLSELFMIDRVAPYYPVLMYYYKEKHQDFDELVAQISRFTFRATLIGLRSYGESHLYTSLRNNENALNLVRDFVDKNWWDINGRASNIVGYENYYHGIGKNIVRYILVSYENSLRKTKGFPMLGFEEYFTANDKEKLSIEHITAQRSRDIDYDEEFNERCLHSIGNLVIDHAGSNSSKSNKNTIDKLHDFNMAPLMSQNEIDESNCRWRDLHEIKSFIMERELKLHSFIRNNFHI